MEENMKVTLRMERKTVRAHSSGPMEINTSAVGEMINNMALASITMLRMDLRNRVSGLTARDTNGLTDIFIFFYLSLSLFKT